jgi:hypothetical protein
VIDTALTHFLLCRKMLIQKRTVRKGEVGSTREQHKVALPKGDSDEKANLSGHAGSGLLTSFSPSALERKGRLAGDDLQR